MAMTSPPVWVINEQNQIRNKKTIPCPRLGVEWIVRISWLPRAHLGPIFMTGLHSEPRTGYRIGYWKPFHRVFVWCLHSPSIVGIHGNAEVTVSISYGVFPPLSAWFTANWDIAQKNGFHSHIQVFIPNLIYHINPYCSGRVHFLHEKYSPTLPLDYSVTTTALLENPDCLLLFGLLMEGFTAYRGRCHENLHVRQTSLRTTRFPTASRRRRIPILVWSRSLYYWRFVTKLINGLIIN